MHDQHCPLRRGIVGLVSLWVLLTAVSHGLAADILASNKQPFSFGPGQTIIDLKRIVWEPLEGMAFPRGEDRHPPRRSGQRRRAIGLLAAQLHLS